MKNIRRLSLLIIASFVFALAAFAAPAVQDQPTSPTVKAARAQVSTITTATAGVIDVMAGEATFRGFGKSTYGLSTCPARRTPVAVTLDRAQPLLRPPIS